jgi:hypothetical protein
MIIGNFAPIELRMDKGALWENFLVSERVKQNAYKGTFAKMYFWRTRLQNEIDFVEERDGEIFAYEFKWKTKKFKIPQSFLESYNAKGTLVGRDNFRNFVKI